ncbi:MAG: hypothetical protein ACOZCL_04505 [Bacillota bacterium]
MRDVKVTVLESNCNRMKKDDFFVVKGDKVHAPFEQGICFYSLSSLTAFFAAWEMDKEHKDHYIKNFTEISCPMRHVMYRAEQIDASELIP